MVHAIKVFFSFDYMGILVLYTYFLRRSSFPSPYFEIIKEHVVTSIVNIQR